MSCFMKKYQLHARVMTTIASTTLKSKTEKGKATYSTPKQSLTRDTDTLQRIIKAKLVFD